MQTNFQHRRRNMEPVEETVRKLMSAYGKPRDGYDEFLAKCKRLSPLMSPTKRPDLCKGYKTPSGVITHDVGIQPYYDSRTMQAKPEDVIVASYPKTGTTWTQEICYLILHDANVDKANQTCLEDRIPYLEVPSIGLHGIAALPAPRLLKSHMPYHELPECFIRNKTKVVYIARNPRDTVVSFYFFLKMVGFFSYTGTVDNFLDMFVAEELICGSFAEHCLGFWDRRHDDNILFLTYEGLHKNLKKSVEEMANFLEKPLTDRQIDTIVDHCSFENMSKNPMTNHSKDRSTVSGPQSETSFMRKGIVGDWKHYFTPEMIVKLDKYIEEKFKDSDLQFEYEI